MRCRASASACAASPPARCAPWRPTACAWPRTPREFLPEAEAALGFPIEVIAGREEARLIYLGVAHTLPNPRNQQLVMDIGGGSTEFIIGRNFEPLQLESLYMGCVSYTLRFFPDGRVDKRSMKEAELAARRELQSIVRAYRETGWEEAVGSSGTAKAIVDLLELNGLSERGITRDGLDELRARLVRAGDASRLKLEGLRADRIPVLPGGIAIMSAAFKEFGLEHMEFSEGALRLGVLYDLLGRYHHDDLREATVGQFMQRYSVDRRQVARVTMTALQLLHQVLPESRDPRTCRCPVSGVGGASARNRHFGGAFQLPQAQRLHPRQCRHAGILAPRPAAPGARRARPSRQAGARHAGGAR